MIDNKKIAHNIDNFSFTGTVASLTNNRDYASGYYQLLENLKTDRTSFWETLSAVGEDVSNVIYENVLHYIDNVANINTCKTIALESVARSLGNNDFSVLRNIAESVPVDILKLIDILSINKTYLLDTRKFNSEFVNDIIERCHNDDISSVISGNMENLEEEEKEQFITSGNISQEKYSIYITDIFFNELARKTFQTYDGEENSTDFVYLNLLSNDILSSNVNDLTMDRVTEGSYSDSSIRNLYQHTDSLYSDYKSLVSRYKAVYNIDSSFDISKIVDDIENGKDYLDNYSGGELSVLNLELEERAKAKFSKTKGYESSKLQTRYAYYHEREVKEYVDFIDKFSLSVINWSIYWLDNNYQLVSSNSGRIMLNSNALEYNALLNQYSIFCNTLSSENEQISLNDFIQNYYLRKDSDDIVITDEQREFLNKTDPLYITASNLKNLCIALTNIRETLKLQTQWNSTIGTKLLAEYIINKYIYEVLLNGVDPTVGAQIIEYSDTTEYFNLGERGNATFFEDLPTSETSTVYTQEDADDGRDGKLNVLDIRSFYLSSLNIKSDVISSDTEFYDFLKSVYNAGVTKSYVTNDGTLNFIDEDIEDYRLLTDRFLSTYMEISANNDFTKADFDYLSSKTLTFDENKFATFHTDIISGYIDEENLLSSLTNSVLDYNEFLSGRVDRQNTLMLSYHGNPVSYQPYYNYKNQDYATFQTHPYIYNFVEHDANNFPIENAFYGNVNDDLIYELQSQTLSVYLGELGNLMHIWRNGSYDYSGYKSRYENSQHVYGKSNANGLYSVSHYDGLFYPPAIELYKKYAYNEISDETLNLTGFSLLSAHMTVCVDSDFYADETELDTNSISSMWHYYSHLNLSDVDRQHITEQLINLSADILEIADANYRVANGSFATPYDITRYGLDYNNNSIILLKHYEDLNLETEIKDNTSGQLWIRFNSHPIAFPAFVKSDLSSYSNIDLDTDSLGGFTSNVLAINNALQEGKSSEFGSKKVVNNCYDFDLGSNGRYLLYAVENPSIDESERKLENAVILTSRIVQRSSLYNENLLRTHYCLGRSGATFLYPTLDGLNLNFNQRNLSGLNKKPSYKFYGFKQSNNTVLATYLEKNTVAYNGTDLLSDLYLNVIEYPNLESSVIAVSTNPVCRQFKYDSSPHIRPLFYPSVLYADNDSKINIGYTTRSDKGKYYSIVVENKFSPNLSSTRYDVIQNFIGYNTLSSQYGKTNLVSNCSTEKSSFDTFDSILTIYDITEDNINNDETLHVIPTLYALNSDASYIPLYPGTDGQNLHALLLDENTNKQISYNKTYNNANVSSRYNPSIELLGYCIPDNLSDNIRDLSSDIENSLVQVDNEYFVLSTNRLSESNAFRNDYLLRAYESYNENLSSYIEIYNEEITLEAEDGNTLQDTYTLTYTFDREEGTTQTITPESNILLLNVLNGKLLHPILYGTVGDILTDSLISSSYDISGSSCSSSNLIAGTINPLVPYEDNSYYNQYSNHIDGITGIRVYAEEGEEGKISVNIEFSLDTSRESITIPENQLVLFIYDGSLKSLQEMHFLEGFKLYPHNAMMSSWTVPWKGYHTEENKDLWKVVYSGFNPETEGWQVSGDRISAYHDLRYEDMSRTYLSTLMDETVLPNRMDIAGILPHTNGNLTTDLEGISALDYLDATTHYFPARQISIKTNEEVEIPDWLLDNTKNSVNNFLLPEIGHRLYELYGETTIPTENISLLDSFMKDSSTFIFQLDDEEDIAKRIESSSLTTYTRLTKDITICHEDREDKVFIEEDNPNDEIIHKVEENNLAYDSINSYSSNKITANDLLGKLKIYVNYERYTKPDIHQEEIRLYFNMQNLFLSPFYRKDSNSDITSLEIKPSTYLSLDSGCDGYLDIAIQLNQKDPDGKLLYTSSLVVLTYHIYNISDDKPKFLISRTYRIGENNLTQVSKQLECWIRLTDTRIELGEEDVDYMGYLKRDVPVIMSGAIYSPVDIKHSSIDISLVDLGIASFSDKDEEYVTTTNISATSKNHFNFKYYLKKNSQILENTVLPVFVESASIVASDTGNEMSYRMYPGKLTILNSNRTYLGRELNMNTSSDSSLSSVSDNSKHHVGYILEELESMRLNSYENKYREMEDNVILVDVSETDRNNILMNEDGEIFLR